MVYRRKNELRLMVLCRDAWHSQKGLTKTEAKRRYISSLIDNMTRYATSTPEARELVSELSFVWDQIKNLTPQQSSSSEEETSPSQRERLRRIHSRGEGLLELEPRSVEGTRDWEGAVFSDAEEDVDSNRSDKRFRRRIARAIEGLKADVALLREEMDVLRSRGGNGHRHPRKRDGILVSIGKWILRFVGVRSCCVRFLTLVFVETCIV